jgi:cell division protein ZapA
VADVRLTICGRQYDVHCADGEEAQLERLAELVEAKARTVAGGTEVRQLLFAALMLADEAQEAQSRPKAPAADGKAELAAATARANELEHALTAAEARVKALENTAPPPAPANAGALERIADRIEALADKMSPAA